MLSSSPKATTNTDTASTVIVSELNIYPVKCCAEISVETATTTPRGFENDRVAQVIDKDGAFCTPRDEKHTKLFHVTPRFTTDTGTGTGSTNGQRLVLQTRNLAEEDVIEIDWSNDTNNEGVGNTSRTSITAEAMDTPGRVKLQDYGDNVAAWMERATGIEGCRLAGIGSDFERHVQVNPDQGEPVPSTTIPSSSSSTDDTAPVDNSLADEAPYLLTNTASLQDLNRRMIDRQKQPVDMRRFRPNIVVTNLRPWEEDSLKKIRISGVEFWVWQRCGRCAMTTIDRDTLSRTLEPLLTLAKFRKRENNMKNFGVHLVPVVPQGQTASSMANGEIHVGDEMEVLEYDEERRAEWSKLFSGEINE